MKGILGWIGVLGFTVACYGCAPTAEILCDAECECEGCSDWQWEDCVRHYEADESEADRRGCLDLYDDWMACREDTWYCAGRDFHTSCNWEHDRLRSCFEPYRN